MPVPSSLVDKLEHCYRAFAGVPAPKHLDVSPYKDPDIGRRVLARPLRELSDEDIGPYAASSTLTVLGDDDYRHFIPRILALAVANTGWHGADPPIIADHLVRSGWANWTPDQQAVIREFFGAAYEWSIDAGSDEPADAQLWLCGNVLLGQALGPMLHQWRHSASPGAAWRLADFHADWIGANDLSKRLPYWEEIPAEVWLAVGRWLLDPATERQLSAALPTIDIHERWSVERELAVIADRSAH